MGSLMDGPFCYLVEMASYISHQLINFIKKIVSREFPRSLDEFCGRNASSYCEDPCYFEGCETPVIPSGMKTLRMLKFDRQVGSCDQNLLMNYICGITQWRLFSWNLHSMFQGMCVFPLFSLRCAWIISSVCLRISLPCVKHLHFQLQSFITRLQKTLNGSSGDIGWLQHTPGMPPSEDGTNIFEEILRRTRRGAESLRHDIRPQHHVRWKQQNYLVAPNHHDIRKLKVPTFSAVTCKFKRFLLVDVRSGQHTLPNSFVYLLIPGLYSNHSPLYFVNTKRFFSKMGLTCHIARIHSEASVEHNAQHLKHYIEEIYWGSGMRVLLLGHSKGGVDASAALSIYWSDLRDKVAGLALVQSPFGGSPTASDTLRHGQLADFETQQVMGFFIRKLLKGDMKALEDLTYDKRREFISKYGIPTGVPIISFHTEADVKLDVIARMYHIAHAELSWLPLPGFMETYACSKRFPLFAPLSAAMAVCALHLQLRYGEKSDGLVTCKDAVVPGSIVVHPSQKLDHAWMVYSSWRRNHGEPDSCEICEALLTLLVERGQRTVGTFC